MIGNNVGYNHDRDKAGDGRPGNQYSRFHFIILRLGLKEGDCIKETLLSQGRLISPTSPPLQKVRHG